MKLSVTIPLATLCLSLINTQGFAGTMGPVPTCDRGHIYASVFGGAGSSPKIGLSQYGTAFYTEAKGGPLAVNAFGEGKNSTEGIIGGQIGYQLAEIVATPFNTPWGLVPGFELEGYYLKSHTKDGLNNNTQRLPLHDFLVSFPMKSGVFLTNAVLSINLSELPRFHPYVAAGIGAAITSISNANATQIAPAEPGINHYNANTQDKETAFAAQTKVGLNFDLTKGFSVFAEYRWLYLSDTNYFFGSTVYPGHSATSNWLVKLDPQHHNLGTIGLRYRI